MTQCFKCKQAIGTVVSRDGPTKLYCPDCFLAYCAGAVRENAFQQCRVPSDTPLAVAVSGGPNSMMLLRELGQLRYKTRDQIRRQHLTPQRQAPAQGGKSRSTPTSSPPARSTPLASSLILLPFHLCEDELVLPLPPPLSSSTSSPSSLHAISGRHEAVNRVRSAMEEQFATLRKYVQQQPPRWVYHGEVPCGHKRTKKQQNNPTAAERTGAAHAGGANIATPELSHRGGGSTSAPSPQPRPQRQAGESGETAAATARLFDDSEIRLFRYSDLLSGTYLSELRYALHVSRLSLSDREALYARVRQQTLCRAAQRVCQEHRQRNAAAAAATAVVVGGVAHEEGIREDAAQCSEEQAPFDEHVSLEGTNSKTRSHLLLGSNAVRCATAALEALVTGAGGEGVVHGAGFRGFTHEVVCLRPLRAMLPKETIMYTRLCGIAGSYTPALCTGTATRSVHRTLEQFVLTMMTSYRTMIFNVLNTVQRLEVHPAAMQELLRGIDDASACHTHVHGEGLAEAGSTQSAGKTTRKALPARTAQLNRTDMCLAAPLHVRRDLGGVNVNEADIDSVIAMCCVCGCPASITSCYRGQNANTAVRQLEMLALNTTSAMTPRTSGASPSTVADAASASEASPTTTGCFLCYACQGLADAWPPSVFGRDSTTENDEQPGNDSTTAAGAAARHGAIASTAALFRLCALFY
ncbi:conserved hypothetical protein [Leishmania major strain Friedlin]|uniref:Cytoplasmic tRNA 2-thiolation protein 2 n=1 Tax=Leishmania major TaxID=5664 RepID=Q4QG75_LEIMA|nr:conserved hypothetical protein [Leishmania major strain Friedlin]CAG9571011.1 hypothetical_protein_-_conserved [Leishmania major strain Friedlin]CAJ02740.1 conserved hypothetical protein [Leishmania major strain Friedlin]|eukprot:XP_001681823.1 conserved hypothetical protein [Leishmania major strain Friedlin]